MSTGGKKCLFKSDWGDVGEEVTKFWDKNCSELTDAVLNLAAHDDASHGQMKGSGLIYAINKHATTQTTFAGSMARVAGDLDFSEQAGWGYTAQIHHATTNTLELLTKQGIQYQSKLEMTGKYWADWGSPDDVWSGLISTGFGKTAAESLLKNQKFYQESVTGDKSIKEPLKNVDEIYLETQTVHAYVTATITLIDAILAGYAATGAILTADQLRSLGWKDHHLGDTKTWESLASLRDNAVEFKSYLDMMIEKIEIILKIRDDWVAMAEKANKELGEKILEHREKCQKRSQDVTLKPESRDKPDGVDQDTWSKMSNLEQLNWYGSQADEEVREWERKGGLLTGGSCDPGTQKLKDWQEKLAELRKQSQAWKDWGTAEQFTEMAGDVIPTAFVGQVMKRTFKEQCLLLSNVHTLARHKAYFLEQKTAARLPYVPSGSVNANACLMAQREPWGFLNQLTQDRSYYAFFDIPPALLSQLSPMIRLYKIESDDRDVERQVEVAFDTHYSATANSNIDNVLLNRDKRGFGVGLKSFNFSYEGSNPFAVKKSIKAKLVLFASSFDDLLVTRGHGADQFRYADLALKTGGKLQELLDRSDANSAAVINNVTKLNFRLKAVVGWQLPTGNFENGSPIPQKNRSALASAIDNSFVTLNLTPTIHEFDVDDQGRVIFTINYLAYIEDFFDQPNFDIFATSTNYMSAMRRKHVIGAYEQHCDPNQAAEFKKTEYKKVAKEKESNLNSILRKLVEQKKMYFIPIPYDKLADFNEQGPFFDFNFSGVKRADVAEGKELTKNFEAQLGAMLKKLETDQDLTQTKMQDLSTNEYIKFFYLSDLVDIVLENIEEALKALKEDISKPGAFELPSELSANKDAKSYWEGVKASEEERLRRLQFHFHHFRVLLGPIELYDYATGTGKNEPNLEGSVNLGDLPISVSYFMNWLTEKVLKKEQTTYTLSVFLNDLLNGLVRNFLNEDRCHDLNIKQKTRIFQSVVTSYANKTGGKDEITDMILKQRSKLANSSKLWMNETGNLPIGKNAQGILNVMGVRDSPINTRQPKQEYNYLVYYGGRVMPSEKMVGNADIDANAGIWHYMIGRKDGIVKTIQLTKTDSPGLKEVRFEQEGYDGLSQLREVYDATITCYGSPNIVPGTYIYIDPRGFSPKDYNARDAYKFLDHKGTEHTIDPMLLTRYGIGGYYMVIKTQNKFSPGEFTTQITAKWVASMEPGKKNKVVSVPRPSKCSIENST